jgi:hypothetical protein
MMFNLKPYRLREQVGEKIISIKKGDTVWCADNISTVRNCVCI